MGDVLSEVIPCHARPWPVMISRHDASWPSMTGKNTSWLVMATCLRLSMPVTADHEQSPVVTDVMNWLTNHDRSPHQPAKHGHDWLRRIMTMFGQTSHYVYLTNGTERQTRYPKGVLDCHATYCNEGDRNSIPTPHPSTPWSKYIFLNLVQALALTPRLTPDRLPGEHCSSFEV